MSDRSRLPRALVEALAPVRSVGVVTGAGVSRESGIPTYRGPGGIYDDPVRGDATVAALSGGTLREDPDRTWHTVADLARRSMQARPGPAHEALARIEAGAERFVLLTQNVDGLHHAAGSRNVIDIHGDVLAVRCMACDWRGRLSREQLAGLESTPPCPACPGGLRPDAVLFGELLPPDKVRRLQEELLYDPPDLVIAAGTTAFFPYIREPVEVAADLGRLTVEVNPERTALTPVVAFHLAGPAGTWLPALADALAARSA